MKKDFKLVVETHEYNGKLYPGVVAYFGDNKFMLHPLTESKKARAYFYDMLSKTLK